MMNSLQTFVGIAKTSPVYYDGAFLLAKINESRNPSESAGVFEEVRANTKDRKLKIQASIELGRIYVIQGESSKAVRILEEFKSEEEGETGKQLQFELGTAYMSANMLNKAADLFSRMLEIYQYEQDVDRIQFLLSVVDLKRGDAQKAAEGFRRIKEINPFSRYIGESQYYIAAAHFDQGDFSQAIKYCEKYLSGQSPEKKYEAIVLQMRAYLKIGDFRKAERIVSTLMYKYSDKLGVDMYLYEFVSKSYDAKRDPKQVENFILKNYPESDSAANIYLFKGDLEYESKNWKKAEINYSAALHIKGNDNLPGVFLKKSLCAFNQGDYEGVVRFLTTEKMNSFSKDVSIRIVVLLA
ncbi:MAG TPA: outer membrane protein assembly factor BamD, partial [Spirochaetota bacterium]|nr:outer membrane protein assembly factor BamD [Spirochaetota bacterium]